MIFVLGDGVGEDDAARALGSGLRDQGETVVLGALDPRAVGNGDTQSPGDGPATMACAATSGDDVADVLARAEGAHGPLHAVVLVSAGREATVAGDLAGLGPAQWRQRVEVPLERTLACFQGAYRRLRGRGGSLMVLVPTLALVGSSGFAPWSAVAEGQRSLAKAAARAWGREGITVACVAVPGALLVPGVATGTAGPDRRGQPEPALASPDLRGAVAPVVASLVSDRWRAVTGATVAVDGGVWMTP
ncbi:MAG TPA: SDR family oxidoreductase [Acidimicrobiales bacterium]|nr:SDR family oxidoreductase [Acidimicrobiales bacterium]